MTDLTERLLKQLVLMSEADAEVFAAALDAPPAPTPRALEAARRYRTLVVHTDEIDRLRAELADGSFYKEADIDRMQNEIDRLRIANDKLGRDLNVLKYGEPDFSWSVHTATMAELTDDIERLRAALQTIVDSYDARSELYTNDADCAGNLADHARAALQETDR